MAASRLLRLPRLALARPWAWRWPSYERGCQWAVLSLATTLVASLFVLLGLKVVSLALFTEVLVCGLGLLFALWTGGLIAMSCTGRGRDSAAQGATPEGAAASPTRAPRVPAGPEELAARCSRIERLCPESPKVLKGEDLATQSAELCAICLEPRLEGQACRALQCGHELHASCIDGWWMSGKAGAVDLLCPLCKHLQSTTSGLPAMRSASAEAV